MSLLLVLGGMTRRPILLALIGFSLASVSLYGAQVEEPNAPLRLQIELLGDADDGVAASLTFRYEGILQNAQGRPYLLGAVLQDGRRVRTIRLSLRPDETRALSTIVVLPVGDVTIEARLLLESEESLPHLLAKVSETLLVEPTGAPYLAGDESGADAILAEGFIPESSDAVRLQPPRRDVAPNLFIVEADVKEPVRRLEFWVDGKKIMTRNAPPYRVELNLGSLPRGVEVKAVGYDRKGNYVDTDAWVVSERENPLEVRITRTVDRGGLNHFDVSVQGPRPVVRVELWSDDRKIVEWSKRPYAVALDASALEGTEYVRATAYTTDGLEATDLLYLSGDRYFERVDVNLVEFPVTVLDPHGRPVTDLTLDDFIVREEGKPVPIAKFGFSSDLPLAVGVLVDQSGSMRERIDEAKGAAVGFLESVMRPGDRGFLGGFSWEASDVSPLVGNISSLRAQLDQISEAEGATALYDAIVSGLYRFRNVEGRKALVIVTDGEDTASRISQEDTIEYVRSSRVPLYFIGIGLSKLEFMTASSLKNLSADTGGVTFLIGNVSELESAYATIEAELRTQYLLGYYADSAGGEETYRTIVVEVPGREVKVRAIRGYIP